jgi:putative MATE family efflux protein
MSSLRASQLPLAPELGGISNARLLRQVFFLATPIMVEHALHMLVGLVDTYMANHLTQEAAAAAAAVGTVSYFLWFIGLTTTGVGTGATALIARARGARHRSLANKVLGQAIGATLILGLVVAAAMYLGRVALVQLTGLEGSAPHYAEAYLRMLCWSIPFSTLMFVANACLRGAGDTVTPAISMVIVDVINILLTYGLVRGAFGLPEMGFYGIALATTIAYITGGILQFGVLLAGRGGIRLYLHRLRPHWHTLRRILRIGIPTAVEGALVWVAQFAVMHTINGMDFTNRIPAAHNNAVRLEALSYMMGFAFGAAAVTMVGQALGARRQDLARRAAYLCYAVAGAIMTSWGLVFIFFSGALARWMSPPDDPRIAELTASCLYITGFIQFAFAAAITFSGALRGAGDTFWVMMINIASILGIRLLGVWVVVHHLGWGLPAIWVVLSLDLLVRGAGLYLRFVQGSWRHVKV